MSVTKLRLPSNPQTYTVTSHRPKKLSIALGMGQTRRCEHSRGILLEGTRPGIEKVMGKLIGSLVQLALNSTHQARTSHRSVSLGPYSDCTEAVEKWPDQWLKTTHSNSGFPTCVSETSAIQCGLSFKRVSTRRDRNKKLGFQEKIHCWAIGIDNISTLGHIDTLWRESDLKYHLCTRNDNW